jgi:hypothetical protein
MSSNTRSSGGSNNLRSIASNSISTLKGSSRGSNNATAIPTSRQVTSYISTNTFIVVLGFLALVGVGVYFYMQFRDFQRAVKAKESGEYTPNQCPDYWTLQDQLKDERGRVVSITCKNDNLLGVCALNPDENTFTFADEIFINPGSKDMARCKWAKQCKVAWSGYDKLCA